MNWFVVYALSVVDGLRHAAGVALGVACGVAVLMTIFSPIVLTELRTAEQAKLIAVGKWVAKPVLLALACAFAIVGFVPSTDSLLRAYLMVEGSKLVTAENAEKATGEIVKRIDKVIAQIGEKP